MPAASMGAKKVSLTFSINWFLLIFGLAVALIAFYFFGRVEWRPGIVFSATVLAAGAALVNAANALDARSSQLGLGRITAAMNSVDRWNAPAFQPCKVHGREVTKFFKEHPTVADQIAYLDQHPEQRGHIMDVLNQFEALSIAIQMNLVDDETAKRFFRSIVNEYWHATEGWTKKRRADRNNGRLLKEFEWLYDQWKD